jgi:DNA invertase Pin-like site-specific DNA recombinase
VKAAQCRGVRFGRKPKLTTEQIKQARKLIDEGESRQYVADPLNIGREPCRFPELKWYNRGHRMPLPNAVST